MQTRDEFVAERSGRWQELVNLLSNERNLHALPATTISRVATLYRAVSADRMRAQSLGCGPDVTGHLDATLGRAHNLLYGPRPYRLHAAWQLVIHGFPRTLRKNFRFFLVALLLFTLPLAFGLFGALKSRQFAFDVLPAEALEQAADSYKEGLGRTGGMNAMMAGFYVRNNVGIAFRCFATGILFGTGTIFFLVYNGLVTGTTVGYVVRAGAGGNILTFVAGHAPFELTAIVIAGAAGLKMGWSLVDTGGRTRIASLRAASRELVELVIGASLMLLVAAAIEGFWSASGIDRRLKWLVSVLGWLFVFGYLSLSGRKERGR